MSDGLAQEIPGTLIYEHISLLDGTVLPKSALQDKIIIANIWATWCRPCLEEIPDLNALVASYEDRTDIIFLAIASSDRDNSLKVEKFLEKSVFRFQHLKPEVRPAFLQWNGTIKYPTTVIYGKSGELQKKFVGRLKPRELAKIRDFLDSSLTE